MTYRHLVLYITIIVFPLLLSGQQRTYTATRVGGDPPVIDGLLKEDIWETAEWTGDFTQQIPTEYDPPTEQTAFKILFDDNNVYVAIRAYDTEPDKIVRRLTRRDHEDGDWVAIGFDSYNDKLTAFGFLVSAAGVKTDGMSTNDTEWDATHDPVWYVKTTVDELGWVAEMKIPLNQLRFADIKDHVWGLQVMRMLFRKQELSLWKMIPRESGRWTSLFGELYGINGINPKKEVALTPYVMGGIELSEKEEGNPYTTGTEWKYNAGLDGKVAITNDLTLNFTVNPDFGQVEADPSVVNLSAYEIFFEERRPFFIEGSNIFNFPLSPFSGGGPTGRDNLFYSRRIGRRPSYEPDLEDNQYSNVSDYTRILGALKLSGKTQNGWSIGIMESVTNPETIEIDTDGEKIKFTAEPLTNYFNTRIQKDINKGNTIIGGMVTATNRRLEDTTSQFLPKAAYTAGFDFKQYWKNRQYYLSTVLAFSYVTGTEEAMLELQESPRRFYQRPDATHLSVDSTLTFLTGNGGSVEGGKLGGGNWRYGLRINWRSPGLELNDMGFIRSADIVHQTAWIRHEVYKPFGVFRSMNTELSQWSGWDFSATNLWAGVNFRWEAEFKNYWYFNTGIRRSMREIERAELRGGPAIYWPGSWETWVFTRTDSRKKLIGKLRASYEWGDHQYKKELGFGGGLTYRPFSALQLSVDPHYNIEFEDSRWFETIELESENRYLLAALDRTTFILNLRINFSITPDLSIQYWGQPFFFSGDYSEFKTVIDPNNSSHHDQYHVFTEDEIQYNATDNSYHVCDPTINSADCSSDNPDYTFENPDFSVYDFRSNFVVRWEYIPGSTVYLVGSQGRAGDSEEGQFDFNDHVRSLVDVKATNIVLLKFSYRFSF